MRKFGKKYNNSAKKVDAEKRYSLEAGCKLVKATAFAKFDETIDMALNLNVDPKHADQMVRGAVVLPHGTGKTVRVAVFAKGELAEKAKEAGADIVGADDLAKLVQAGEMNFDKVIATPDMMAVVGRLGKVLGPRGLMPNPKVGTVTRDVAKAVKEVKGGKIEFRVDKTGQLHAPIGKASFAEDKLLENATVLLEAIRRARPAVVKGDYMRKVTLSATMGPAVRLDPSEAMG